MSGVPLVKLAASDIAATAHYYSHTYDPAKETVALIRLSEADYNFASFLDERILTPNMRLTRVKLAELAAIKEMIARQKLHFIFHAGHVGSTLVSRLLDTIPGVLGLREPTALRVLADMGDDETQGARFAERLDLFLSLFARGFTDTKMVILKATSMVGRIAPQILAAQPEARAVYMNLPPESFIAALLAAANGESDLREFAAVRGRRLDKILGKPFETPSSTGELAAIAWLVERAAEQALAGDPRVLMVDFEELLADLGPGMSRIAAHFGLPPDSGSGMTDSPVLRQYSKAPDQLGFSPAHRVDMMKRARNQFGAEIEKGLALLESLRRHKPVIALLSR